MDIESSDEKNDDYEDKRRAERYCSHCGMARENDWPFGLHFICDIATLKAGETGELDWVDLVQDNRGGLATKSACDVCTRFAYFHY